MGFQTQQNGHGFLCRRLLLAHQKRSGVCRRLPMYLVPCIPRRIGTDARRQKRIGENALRHETLSHSRAETLGQQQSGAAKPPGKHCQRSAQFLRRKGEPHRSQQIRRHQHHMLHRIYATLFTSHLPDTADPGVATHREKSRDKSGGTAYRAVGLRKVQPRRQGQLRLHPRNGQRLVVGHGFGKGNRFALCGVGIGELAAVGQPTKPIFLIQSDLGKEHQQDQTDSH